MRISDRLVVQLVDSRPPRLVLVDDQTGAEITLDKTDLVRFYAVAGYFAAEMDVTKGDVTTEYDRGVSARLG